MLGILGSFVFSAQACASGHLDILAVGVRRRTLAGELSITRARKFPAHVFD